MQMRGILGRYLLRETAQTWLVTTLVLLLILVTYQFANVLSDAAAAEIPKDTIFRVLVLASARLLAILTPVALFLSILITVGRLYRDSEMAALMACGIGPAGLYRPLLILAMLLAIGVGWLSLVVGPAASRDVEQIVRDARKNADLGLLMPGRFMSFGSTGMVIYAEQVSKDGRLGNVFVQQRDGDKIELVLAREAWQSQREGDDVRVLHFGEGRRYLGVPGSAKFQIVHFQEYGIPLSVPEAGAAELDPDARPLLTLIGSPDPAERAELQWRISMPLTVIVLTLLAVPLGRSAPRQGRYSGLIAGILVFIVYANLLTAAKVWVSRETLPPAIGMWWVHLLFAGVALYLINRQQGVRRRRQRKTVVATA